MGRTIELPDAISGVAEAPFGWYVGCRDGFLYALDRSGDLHWRWQTPGAAAFGASGPGEVYFRPSPYRLASNGRAALVSWWGSLWCVGPDGVSEWGLRLQDLGDRGVTEIRLRGRQAAAKAAAALGVSAQASPREIKRAYREAVRQAHPDLHPDDASAAERFRRVQKAYESLSGQGAVTGNGAGLIRFRFPSLPTVSFLDVVERDWLVGGSGGTLFRLSSQGRLLARVRIATGAVVPVRDASQAVVAFCSQPVASCSQPNLWFVDADAPVRLPDQYPWPDHLLGSYGNFLLAHRPRGRELGLIDESGALVVQLRCARAITSVCVAEGALVLAAGALICLEVDGLSPLRRTRVWRPPFTRAGFHQPTDSGAPKAS